MSATTATSTTPARPLPNERCPLCGGPNGCAPAACGRFDVDCWCAEARIVPQALARLPAEQRGIACICASCAADAPEVATAPPQRTPTT